MKKTLAIILTIVMCMLAIPASALEYGAEYQKLPTPQIVQKFSDVPSTHWAFDYIGEMAQRDVISGYPDGRFLPENQVTRAEFAKIMVCAAGLTIKTPVTVDGSSYEEIQMNQPQGVGYNFGCVALSDGSWIWDVFLGDWYAPYVFTAVNYMNFYKNPYDDGLDFKPTTPALREDIAVALVKLKGYDISLADESILNMFTDSYSISTSARKYVAVAVERGIVSGYEDNTFRGQATITRAEAATLLWRAFQYGNDNKVTESLESVVKPPKSSEQPSVTPKPTEKPNSIIDENEPDSTDERIKKHTPAPIKKPYKVDTIVKASVSDIWCYTQDDDDNIYYVSGGKLYKVNAYHKDKEEVFDFADLTIDTEEITLDDFEAKSICCNKNNDSVLVSGDYQFVDAAETPNNKYLYEIKNGKATVLTDNWQRDNLQVDIWGGNLQRNKVLGVLSNGDIVSEDSLYDGSDYEYIDKYNDNEFGDAAYAVIEKGNELYYYYSNYHDSDFGYCYTLYKYDYVNSKNIVLTKHGELIGVSSDKVVVIGKHKMIETCDFSGNTLNTISFDDIEVTDKKGLDTSNMLVKMLLTNDEDIIFYDEKIGAFRMISKNN